MAILAPLSAITFTATEIAAVQTAAGYEDAPGMMSTIKNEIAECIIKLNALATHVPAGANLTAIQAAATALA